MIAGNDLLQHLYFLLEPRQQFLGGGIIVLLLPYPPRHQPTTNEVHPITRLRRIIRPCVMCADRQPIAPTDAHPQLHFATTDINNKASARFANLLLLCRCTI
jgi:hypothetical protein